MNPLDIKTRKVEVTGRTLLAYVRPDVVVKAGDFLTFRINGKTVDRTRTEFGGLWSEARMYCDEDQRLIFEYDVTPQED